MKRDVWLSLSPVERSVIAEALTAYSAVKPEDSNFLSALAQRIARAKSNPDICVGVFGGQVQWALGNPFPIRICDYDGDDDELPDIDERGQRCRMWSL